jgi:hypothetical protein
MRNFLLSVLFFSSVLFLFLSNSSGVPQAVTKAPGESGFNCGACHSGGNYNAQIQLDVKDTSGNIIQQYLPDEIYNMEVTVSGVNNPRSFGFQMVSLANADNKDVGIWSDLGQRVKTITLLQRKYVVQSSPKQDGVFTMKWKAPATDIGSVSFYFSGMAVNLNGNVNGDSPVSGKLTLPSPSTSSSAEIVFEKPLVIYPNPVRESLFLAENPLVSSYIIYDVSGKTVRKGSEIMSEGVYVQDLPPGLYFLETTSGSAGKIQRNSFMKY